jgi:hypothetical protein
MAGNPSAQDELVPLDVAVLEVYKAIYEARERSVPTPERLSGLAHGILTLISVYSATAGTDARLVTEAELTGALVRRSGKELHYVDGRPPVRDLAVTRTSISKIIEKLRSH